MGSGDGFSRAMEAPKGRHIYFAGAAPNSVDHVTVPGGILEQADACFGKLKALVEEAGGTMADFVMLNMYVTEAKYLREIRSIRDKYFTEPPYPPGSGFAVLALAHPDWLIEVDGVAVIPE
jgi:enamine deaminase RidA (YjgF/YER057c/UK114 family)